jgi:hypothetical protein
VKVLKLIKKNGSSTAGCETKECFYFYFSVVMMCFFRSATYGTAPGALCFRVFSSFFFRESNMIFFFSDADEMAFGM